MNAKNGKTGRVNIPNKLAGDVVDEELRKLIQKNNSPEKLFGLKVLFSRWSAQIEEFERSVSQVSNQIGMVSHPRFKWTPESSN